VSVTRRRTARISPAGHRRAEAEGEDHDDLQPHARRLYPEEHRKADEHFREMCAGLHCHQRNRNRVGRSGVSSAVMIQQMHHRSPAQTLLLIVVSVIFAEFSIPEMLARA
jgi:hypothetical protein